MKNSPPAPASARKAVLTTSKAIQKDAPKQCKSFYELFFYKNIKTLALPFP